MSVCINERTSVHPRVAQAVFIRPDYKAHYLNSYSYLDHNIELEDGSFWSIRAEDMYKIPGWASNDPLLIMPNRSILGSTYLIQNLVTGQQVEAELLLGPVAFGPNTHWVVSIDPWLHRIYLEDGSFWTVRGLDSISNWAINDTIIIGDGRNEWFGNHDSILINVNLNKYVYANQGV